ncbi:hypothetical protein ACI50M_01155, partial [Escherichia coli]|uniref:hypothetical protein n=1 Tax=Escherichia coli TaxID=562 RepID=UPI0038CC10A6
SVHHIWCPLFSQEFQDLPDGAETTLTSIGMETAFFWYVTLMAVVAFLVSLMLHRKGKGMRL